MGLDSRERNTALGAQRRMSGFQRSLWWHWVHSHPRYGFTTNIKLHLPSLRAQGSWRGSTHNWGHWKLSPWGPCAAGGSGDSGTLPCSCLSGGVTGTPPEPEDRARVRSPVWLEVVGRVGGTGLLGASPASHGGTPSPAPFPGTS